MFRNSKVPLAIALEAARMLPFIDGGKWLADDDADNPPAG
jgi:hypothetical protein